RARKSRLRTAVTVSAVAAGTAGLVAGSLYVVRMDDRSGGEKKAALTGEQASDARRAAAGTLAARLTERLGARTAGAYLDRSGRPVVTVTNADDAAMVRAAGAVPKMTRRSPATL